MKKYNTLIFLCFSIVLVPSIAIAESTIYQIGNSGYKVREAMHACQEKMQPREYRQAVQYQRKARVLFARRALDRARDSSKQAERLAKIAYHQCRQESY